MCPRSSPPSPWLSGASGEAGPGVSSWPHLQAADCFHRDPPQSGNHSGRTWALRSRTVPANSIVSFVGDTALGIGESISLYDDIQSFSLNKFLLSAVACSIGPDSDIMALPS